MKRIDIQNNILSKTVRAILLLIVLVGSLNAKAQTVYHWDSVSDIPHNGTKYLIDSDYDNATIIIDENIEVNSYIDVTAVNLILDLNNHSITLNLGNVGANCRLLNIFGNNFTLTDNSTDKDGALIGPQAARPGVSGADRGGAIFMGANLTMNFTGGTIRHFTPSSDGSTHIDNGETTGCGGAVYINDGCTFIMDGGNISNCSAPGRKGGAVFVSALTGGKTTKFTMRSGSIKNCHSYDGGAVYLYSTKQNSNPSNAVFEMTGGSIEECVAITTGANIDWNSDASYYTTSGSNVSDACAGGAVYIDANYGNCTFSMTGGTIYKCTAGAGGGIFVDAQDYTGSSAISVFNMHGGTIDLCHSRVRETETGTTNWGGGGIMSACGSTGLHPGKINITSGTISNCLSNLYGGAIMLKGPLNMSGGTIESCKSGDSGGCIFSSIGNITMSGGTIRNCETYHYGGGIYLKNTASMNMSGGKITGCYNTVLKDIYYPSRKSTGSYGGGVLVYSGASLNMTGGEISNNRSCSGGGVMVMAASTFIMDGNDAVIEANEAIGDGYNGNGGGVYVDNSTFNFKNGTIKGNKANRYGGAANINMNASLTLEGNCNITNNIATHGGGLSQEDGDCKITLNAPNIKITGNVANGIWGHQINNGTEGIGYGGGLFIEKGTLVASAGLIESNTATGGGGGISFFLQRVSGNIKADISNKFVLNDNHATNKSGGAIYIYTNNADNTIANTVNVNVNGGSLTSNTAGEHGGAIYVYVMDQSTTTVNLGQAGTFDVSKNTAGRFGGAFGCFSEYPDRCNVNIYNGNIYDNTAGWSGGGVYVNNGKLTINSTGSSVQQDVNIYLNTAKNKGGGIHLVDGDATLNKCNIYNNTAWARGGGMSIEHGNLTVTGEISLKDNKVTSEKVGEEHYGGGGISMYGGSVTMQKGIISGNTVTNGKGGGLYVLTENEQVEVSLTGGGFTNNTAFNGGGICVDGDIQMNLSTNVEANTATNGGGICLLNGAHMNFGDGMIRSNTAKTKTAQTLTSAYGLSANEVEGVGGGVFMDDNTELVFSSTTNFGLYNNRADFAADDIFANGNSTKITLPAVAGMKLTDFNVPTGNLYWQEDYVNGDEKYRSNGTAQAASGESALRYQYALKNGLPTYHISNEMINTPLSNKYICLALGYDMVYVRLIKKGLWNNDDAIFRISYFNNNQFTHYCDVFMSGVAEGTDVERLIALPTGNWKFEESPWSWHYNNDDGKGGKPTFAPAHNATGYISIGKDDKNKVLINGIQQDYITVTNAIDKSDIRNDEHRVYNRLQPSATAIE